MTRKKRMVVRLRVIRVPVAGISNFHKILLKLNAIKTLRIEGTDDRCRNISMTIDAQDLIAIPQVKVPFADGGDLVEVRFYNIDFRNGADTCFKNQDHSVHGWLIYNGRKLFDWTVSARIKN
jgi:hypothetical protein